MKIRRLERSDLVDGFDCGDQALNTYLKRYAWKNQVRLLVGVTYVACDLGPPPSVIGFYTLAAAAIPREAFAKEVIGSLPPYQNLPAVLLARLAVDRRFQRSGLGKDLLRHAFENVLSLSEQAGCCYLLVDAYPNAVAWYAKYGFLVIDGLSPGGTQLMFIELRTLRPGAP